MTIYTEIQIKRIQLLTFFEGILVYYSGADLIFASLSYVDM
jgi:hypothetical protein